MTRTFGFVTQYIILQPERKLVFEARQKIEVVAAAAAFIQDLSIQGLLLA